MSDWQSLDDIQLLELGKNGDTEAFGALYERYAARVYRFIYAQLGNHLDAEDLAEEVFLLAWHALPTFEQRGLPFLAFLFRIARNALIDHYRRVGRSQQPISTEEIKLADPEPGPLEKAISSAEVEELHRILHHLNKDQRTVLTLRFFSGLSPEEIALTMRRSTGTIRVLQHRALLALRKLLKG